MMIMRWCTVHTNEYDLQAKTYQNICTHHKLHNDNENKFRVFLERICNKRQKYDVTNISGTEKYDNNGKGGYFRFDYDSDMSYR